MPSTKPTKLINPPTSASSSTGTPRSSQLKFQLPSSIQIPLASTVTPPYTPTFPSSPTPTAHFLFSVPRSTSCHHLVPHPPSKVLPATPASSSYVAQHVAEEMQVSSPVVPHVACGLKHLEFAGKDKNKVVSCRYSFLYVFIQL